MSDTRFKRTIEDFNCEHCGYFVVGSGYTNHCPMCLWSKHVDFYPGDRGASCGGLMEPTALEQERGEYTILHKCQKCDCEKRNKAVKEDSIDIFFKDSFQR